MFEMTQQGSIDVISGDSPLTCDRLSEMNELLQNSSTFGQPRAVLDMHQVKLIDSAGLEWLLDIQESFERRGGSLKLASPTTLCRDILKVAGIDKRFEVFANVRAAVGSFIT
jgi:anti-anti-sigma factor